MRRRRDGAQAPEEPPTFQVVGGCCRWLSPATGPARPAGAGRLGGSASGCFRRPGRTLKQPFTARRLAGRHPCLRAMPSLSFGVLGGRLRIDSPGQRRALRRLPNPFLAAPSHARGMTRLGLRLALDGPRETGWASAAWSASLAAAQQLCAPGFRGRNPCTAHPWG